MKTEIRNIPGSKYNEALEKVVEFCHKNPETVYKPKDLVRLLGLDLPSRGLQASLKLRHEKIGLLKIYDEQFAYFGYSESCGSGECYSSWCSKDASSTICRTGKGNERIKFFK